MENFKAGALTSTGTVLTEEGEIILASLDNVSLHTHDKRPTPYISGLITVTTHRVVWTDRARQSCIFCHLSLLPQHGPVEKKSFSTKLLLRVGNGVRLEFGSANTKERELFVNEIGKAVLQKEWERVAEVKRRAEEKKAKEGEYVRRRLGAGGVLDKVAGKDYETGHSIVSGFGSLDQLRSQAEDLMSIARRFRVEGGKMEGSGEEENELLNMMAEMGIESPVTKDMSGGNVKLYREQLARQMAEFLRVPILNVGGIMTLSDAYCLVMRNRASTELVGPEDFRISCGYFQRLGLKIEVVKLESGVLALSLDASRDSSGAQSLKKMSEEGGSLSAIDVVRIRHVPIQRATSMLEDAERAGFLARDETTDGVRFFPNLFVDFTESKMPSQPVNA